MKTRVWWELLRYNTQYMLKYAFFYGYDVIPHNHISIFSYVNLGSYKQYCCLTMLTRLDFVSSYRAPQVPKMGWSEG